jgi:Ca-activated chloride channel family protein
VIQPPTVSAAYRPRPPRNTRALAVTLAATVLISGLLLWANSSCLELVVATSKEKFGLVTSIAKAYEPQAPRVDRKCVTVTVIERASGSAEIALRTGWANESGPRPDVWWPAATTWLLLLSHHRPDLVPAVAQPIMQSPLVIAMPEPMALTLQTSSKSIGWHDVLALARDPEGWARFGKPWGRFRLGKTTPRISTSGLHAMIGLDNAAQAEVAPVTFLQGVESSVSHYADSVGSFLANLREADDDGRELQYVSAIAVEEKQVFDYNRGNTGSVYCKTCEFKEPHTKLMAVYPKEGTLIADHPYAVLTWVDAAHRQAAADFQDHLESDSVQRLFQQVGFRNHRREAGDLLQRPYFDPVGASFYHTPPTSAALNELINTWSATIRKRSNALILLDVGPDSPTGLGTTKLAAVKEAITVAAEEVLADDDAIGLWTFPTADGRPYEEVLPITTRGPSPFELATRLEKVVPVTASRELYRTVRAAAERIQAGFRDDRVNAVIVVSNGLNGTSDNLANLLKALHDQPDDQRVLILTVALGETVIDDLRQIARESRGLFYDASDPQKIGELIRNALANL